VQFREKSLKLHISNQYLGERISIASLFWKEFAFYPGDAQKYSLKVIALFLKATYRVLKFDPLPKHEP